MFRLLRRIAGVQSVASATAVGVIAVGALSLFAIARPQPVGTTPATVASITSLAAWHVMMPAPANPDSPTAIQNSGDHQVVPVPASPPADPQAANATLLLGPADYGTTVTVSPGTLILVRLPGAVRFRWTVPSSSDVQIVRLISGSAGSDGSSQASFVAGQQGNAVLSAIDNPLCFPICELPPAGGWRVTVVVK